MNPRDSELDHERLLESLLDREVSDRGKRVHSTACTDTEAAELAALDDFLKKTRADLTRPELPWSDVREGALVGRVLAKTTREDLTWRGELALLSSFVRERLGASRILRLVAASLVLHLVAVPAVAWYLQREGEERPLFFTGIESPIEDSLEEVPDEEAVERFPLHDDSQDGGRGPYAADAIQNAIRRARFVLTTRRGPVLTADASGESLERMWLIRRTRFLTDRSWNSDWDAAEIRAAGPDRAGRLTNLLRAELLLDHYALLARRHPHLDALLSDLELTQLEARSEERFLVDAVLDRARAYGLWHWTPGFKPLAVPVPLGAEWFEALVRAARGTPLSGLLGREQFGGWVGS